MLSALVVLRVGRVLKLRDEQGQGMVEYAFILALVSLIVIASLALIGNQLLSAFQSFVDLVRNPSG